MKLEIKQQNHSRAPFFDGMDEDKAVLHVSCCNCDHEFNENLLSAISRGDDWYCYLTESEQRYISKTFKYKFELVGQNQNPSAFLKSGHVAYFVNLLCSKCKSTTLFVIDFYEMQPTRYIASLVSVAELEI